MKILLDNCVVRRFGDLLEGHEVIHASRLGWAELENGDLIRAAEADGFDVMITVDKNVQYQQNVTGRRISIIVLTPRFVFYDQIAALAPSIKLALANLPQGSFIAIGPVSI
ncbi:MAG TPA: hypothetical protein VK171_16135 [Fimbriimonas sp.]|nr:hypothetical protein [Fimbriimonas sp.]